MAKVVTAESLQALLQLIATDIKSKADCSHVHSDYVTTAAFNQALANINSFNVEVVSSLPNDNIDTHTIYLVSKEGEESDVYDEYLYISGKWEHIGNTQVDLTDYVTFTNLSTELAKKADKEHTHEMSNITGLSSALSGKADSSHTHSYSDITNPPTIPTKVSELTNDKNFQTASDVDTKIANAVTGGSLDLSGYVTEEELTAALSGKANSTHTHGIAEVSGLQTALDGKASSTHNHDDVYIKSADIEFSTASEAPTMWANAKS